MTYKKIMIIILQKKSKRWDMQMWILSIRWILIKFTVNIYKFMLYMFIISAKLLPETLKIESDSQVPFPKCWLQEINCEHMLPFWEKQS